MRFLLIMLLFCGLSTPAFARVNDGECRFADCSPAPYNVGKPKPKVSKPKVAPRKPVAKPKPKPKPAPEAPAPKVEKDPAPAEETIKVTPVPNVPAEPLDLEQIVDPYIALFDRNGRFYGQYKVKGKVRRVGSKGPMVFEQVCTDEERKTIFDGRCKRWRLMEKTDPLNRTDTPYWSFVTESGRLIVWDQVAIVSLSPLPIKEKGVLQ